MKLNYPVLSAWTWYNHNCPYQRKIGVRARDEGNELKAAQIGGMCFEDGGRGYKPKNTGGHWKLKKAGNSFSLTSLQKEPVMPTL